MGKNNNLCSKFKTVYQRDDNIVNILKENEIQILENVNDCFIEKFIIKISTFIKKNIQLVSYSMRVGSYNFNINTKKNFNYFNVIETLPVKNESVIVFSSNFLPIIIDILFGGHGNLKNEVRKQLQIKSTEFYINKKIVKFIINIYSDMCKKYFESEISFNHTKTVVDVKKFSFYETKIFLINSFIFNINNIEVFFSILIPISILKQIKKKRVFPIKSKDEIIYADKIIKKRMSFNNIFDVKINIITKIINISISYNQFHNLSIGDVFLIKKPNKVVGFIEEKPVFFGNYKRFNEQAIVFIEKFINNDLIFNKNKEYSNE